MKNLRSVSITLMLCLSVHFVFSQAYELSTFKKSKDLKIQVGMSIQEVKNTIGNPKAVQLGFPSDENEKIIYSDPIMSGQLNYSTWIYFYEPILLDLNENQHQGYFINAMPVTKFDYDCYKNLAEVYLYEGKIINPDMATSYKQIKSNKLSTVPKSGQYYNQSEKASKRSPLIPLYCVIFDKGTQVVAQTKAYFLR